MNINCKIETEWEKCSVSVESALMYAGFADLLSLFNTEIYFLTQRGKLLKFQRFVSISTLLSLRVEF